MYQTGYGLEIENKPYLTRKKLSIYPSVNDRWHIVTEGDKIDALAWRYYKAFVKDADKLGWILADANNVSKPFDLSIYAGRFFLIPDFWRVQRLIDETRSNNLRNYTLGEQVQSSEIVEGYSINQIYPISFGSLGGGDIIPDYSDPNTPVDPVTPTTNRVRLFFEKPNNGGYVLASVDEDGTTTYINNADPTLYENVLIALQP